MQSRSFKVFAKPDAQVLILGTMPGQASLKAQRYYAHPQNAFWRIICELCGAASDLTYEKRVALLPKHKIALWDVLEECFRPGSMDSAITKAVPNDFAQFFAAHSKIKLIAFNGQPAAKLYRQYVLKTLPEAYRDIPTVILPSTSPAYASMTLPKKMAVWRKALAPFLSPK